MTADRTRGVLRASALGVCAWIYGDAPIDETLGRIAGAGYDGVELPGEPERWRPAEIRRLLSRHRLVPLALTASCKVPETRRDLAHPDPAVRSEAVQYLVMCLRFAADVGVPLAQMLPSGETRLAPLAVRDDEWRWSVEGMQTAAREAERLGVRIAIEPVNRYEAYLVTTVADALAYLNAVASPWVGMTLDLFHANIEERTIREAISTSGRRLWHLHAADTNRQGLGRGHLDVPALTAALREIDYSGAVALEVVPPGPDPFRTITDDQSRRMLDGYLHESIASLRRHLGAGSR